MSTYKVIFFSLFLICLSFTSSQKIKTLYSSIEKDSLPKHFAFYSLFPNSKEASRVKFHLTQLIKAQLPPFLFDEKIAFQTATLFTANVEAENEFLNSTTIQELKKLTKDFPNRKLKGYTVDTLEELLKLNDCEIDLAKGLLFLDTATQPFYETLIDLMVFQIDLYLPKNPTPIDKIKAINHFLFYDLGIKFPPESLFAKNIDTYTFLSSILDSRLGVCLGVSALYLCLAQRLDLDLEIITPPGHIYVRHRDKAGKELNIETTARGIHIPSEHYLGVNTKALQLRNIKEVLGLVLINEASVYWQNKDYQKAITTYEKALLFLPEDALLHELLGIQYFLTGQIKKAKEHLLFAKMHPAPHFVYTSTLTEDILKGHASKEAIESVFEHIDPTYESVVKKQKDLEEQIRKNPHFSTGYFHLAIATLQLGQEYKAIPILARYLTFHPKDPVAHYYLAAILQERLQFEKAWKHLKISEQLLADQKKPKALLDLKLQLKKMYPTQPESSLKE